MSSSGPSNDVTGRSTERPPVTPVRDLGPAFVSPPTLGSQLRPGLVLAARLSSRSVVQSTGLVAPQREQLPPGHTSRVLPPFRHPAEAALPAGGPMAQRTTLARWPGRHLLQIPASTIPAPARLVPITRPPTHPQAYLPGPQGANAPHQGVPEARPAGRKATVGGGSTGGTAGARGGPERGLVQLLVSEVPQVSASTVE